MTVGKIEARTALMCEKPGALLPDTFWPDLLVALIATTFGAVLTVGIAFATYRYEVRTREREAIRPKCG